MVETWLVLSIVTLIIWGMWGFLIKLALNYLEWKQVFIISGITSTIIYLILFLIWRPSISFKNMGTLYSILIGLTILGSITFYSAISRGKVSVVVPLTALYPIISTILAFIILQEKISLFQGLGIFLAIGSIILLSLS